MIPIFIELFRLAMPFSIIRWQFIGAVLSMTSDYFDFAVMQKYGWGILEGTGLYQTYDKTLDLYFIVFLFFASQKWKDALARDAAKNLFLFRLVGVIIFIIIGNETILLFFPDVITYFFIILSGIYLVRPKFYFRQKIHIMLFIIAVTIPVLFLEYEIHCDDFFWVHKMNNYLSIKF